ncbi:MAG: NAD-dependent epimerase/dehydratase family protein [Thermoplasmata archaeon]
MKNLPVTLRWAGSLPSARLAMTMRVLVTGGAGYLGSVLVPELLGRDHSVRVLDRLFFGAEPLASAGPPERLTIQRDDIRWCDPQVLTGFDAVVDLAALSNDPAGALDPSKTFEINQRGRIRIATLARAAGVRRYLLPSSCSVYGFHPDLRNEGSEIAPLTAYAQANAMAEAGVRALSSPEFSVTVLRLATLYGPSPRMRFDLALNGMTRSGLVDHRVPLMRDGGQWRPFVDVRDAARLIVDLLEAPLDQVRDGLFNVGSNEQNYPLRRLAEIVAEGLEGHPEITRYGDADRRSYRVDFSRLQERFGFRPRHTPESAVREIAERWADGRLPRGPITETVTWYRHLLSGSPEGEAVRLRGVIL